MATSRVTVEKQTRNPRSWSLRKEARETPQATDWDWFEKDVTAKDGAWRYRKRGPKEARSYKTKKSELQKIADSQGGGSLLDIWGRACGGLGDRVSQKRDGSLLRVVDQKGPRKAKGDPKKQ